MWWKGVCSLELEGEGSHGGWLAESFRKMVENGQEMCFGFEHWVEDGLLYHRFLRLFKLSSNKGEKISDLCG